MGTEMLDIVANASNIKDAKDDFERIIYIEPWRNFPVKCTTLKETLTNIFWHQGNMQNNIWEQQNMKKMKVGIRQK